MGKGCEGWGRDVRGGKECEGWGRDVRGGEGI